MKPIFYVRAVYGAMILAALLSVQGVAGAQSHPRVSPGGDQVAHFRFDLEAGTSDILVTDLATGETTPQPSGQGWSVNPVWSSEGDSIVFIGGPRGMRDVWDVYEVRLSDGAVTALTRTPEREMHSQVSPNGDQVAFVRMTQGPHVWLLDRGATEARQLTTGPARDFHPKWMPDGSGLIFDRSDDATSSRIVRVSVTDGTETVLGEAPAIGRLRLPNVGPTGEVYAIQSVDTDYALVQLHDDGVTDTVLHANQGEVFGAFDIHPDGQSVFLTVTGLDDRERLYRVELGSGSRSLVYE